MLDYLELPGTEPASALALCLAHYAGRPTDFVHFDCVRFALDVVGGGPGRGADVALRHGLRLDWTCDRSALREVRRFGGTLASGVAQLLGAEGWSRVRVAEAGQGAVGFAPARSIFGATVCVSGPANWLTVSGPEGFVGVDEVSIMSAWARG